MLQPTAQVSHDQEAKAQPIDEKPKAQYRVRNWAKYNDSLKQRGDITLWIAEDVIEAWGPDPQAPKKRVGRKRTAMAR